MKIGILTLFLLSALAAAGQKEYVIEGKTGRVVDGAVAILMEWRDNMGERIAVDTIRNGKFLFRGRPGQEVVRMTVNIKGDTSFYGDCTLWVSNGITKITADDPCVLLWKVKSRLKQQKEENHFVKQMAGSTRKYWSYRHQNQRGLEAEWRDGRKKKPEMPDYPLSRHLDSLSRLKLLANLRALEKSTVITEVGLERLYVLAHHLFYASRPLITREDVEKLWRRIDPGLAERSRVYQIRAYLYPYKPVQVGDEMADDTLLGPDGRKKKISDYKGKYILLDFWHSACGPCFAAHPELGRVTETFQDSLLVISISMDPSEEMWRKSSAGLKGINLWDRLGEGGLVAKYGFVGTPQFVLIEPSGKVVDKWMGYRKGEIEQKIKSSLSKDNDSKNF